MSVAAFAQSPCPAVVATSATACSSGPIQLNATTGFTTYSWLPAAGLSNAAISNPVAMTSGNYTVTAIIPGAELVVNGDFAAGNTGFTSGQNYSTTYSACNYYVGATWFSTFFPGLTDHTATADNMFMHVDGCSPVTTLWEETVPVTPNTNYSFSFWASRSDQVQPTFDMFFIGNVSGNVNVGTQTGIPYTGTWMWDQYGVPFWNSGANTSVTLRVVNQQTNGFGNDFGLDDFSFRTQCVETDSVQVTIAPLPALGPDTILCGNTTLQLNGGPATSYLWNTGDTTQNITVNAPGQYYVTTTTGNCTFSDTINITMNPVPVIDIGADTTFCGPVTLLLDAGSSGSYIWNNSNTTQTLNVTTAGTYFVTVTIAGCSNSDTIVVTEILPPVINDTAICMGQTATFTSTIADSWLWNTGSSLQSITATANGYYWVDAIENGCTLRDSAMLTVIPVPVIELGDDTTLCPSENVLLDVTGAPEYTYLWNTNAVTPALLVDSTGNYSVTVSVSGCSVSDSIRVTVADPLELGDAQTLCGRFNLTLNAGNPGATYVWNDGSSQQTFDISSPGIYWVQVSQGACVRTDSIEITGIEGEGMLFIPNTFTPNGNGNNDLFRAYGLGITAFHMRIFNRWGELIFESSDINAAWDGRYKGQIVQTDTYVYTIDYETTCEGTDVKNKIGHVNVVR